MIIALHNEWFKKDILYYMYYFIIFFQIAKLAEEKEGHEQGSTDDPFEVRDIALKICHSLAFSYSPTYMKYFS